MGFLKGIMGGSKSKSQSVHESVHEKISQLKGIIKDEYYETLVRKKNILNNMDANYVAYLILYNIKDKFKNDPATFQAIMDNLYKEPTKPRNCEFVSYESSENALFLLFSAKKKNIFFVITKYDKNIKKKLQNLGFRVSDKDSNEFFKYPDVLIGDQHLQKWLGRKKHGRNTTMKSMKNNKDVKAAISAISAISAMSNTGAPAGAQYHQYCYGS